MNISSGIVLAGFALNAIVAAYGLYRDRQPYSLVQVFWIFCLLFMSLVPLLQFIADIRPWGRHFENAVYIHANAVISVTLLCCLLVFGKRHELVVPADIPVAVSWSRYRMPGLFIFFLAAVALIVLHWPAIFWRSSADGTSLRNHPSLELLTDKMLRGIVLYFTLLSIYLYRQAKVSKPLLAVVMLAAVISNFPLAVPRYWAAAFGIALLVLFFRAYLQRKPALFRTVLSLAILIVFPVLSLTRYSAAYIAQHFKNAADVFRLSFAYGDFDAYTSFCSTISYVQLHGTTSGKQLLTVLLFFVPRSYWPAKGVGSGALVNQLPGSDFTNFCSPLFAEGYINFGIPGAVLFVVLFAWLIRRYDQYYHSSGRRSFAWFFYPVALGMSFFILRGDLLSSFAYTCGFFVSGYTMHALLRDKRA